MFLQSLWQNGSTFRILNRVVLFFLKNHIHYKTIVSTSDFTVGGSRRDTPSPEDLYLSLSASIASHPLAALSFSPLSQMKKKKIVTHLLCVCLNNNIYILLSFLFSFFSCLLSNIAHQSSWQGPVGQDAPFKLAGRWGSLGQEAGQGRGCRAGRQAVGLRRVAGPACSGWLFGWCLGLSWDQLFPRTPRVSCYPSASSTG